LKQHFSRRTIMRDAFNDFKIFEHAKYPFGQNPKLNVCLCKGATIVPTE
jgi:hypothetical protein